MKRLTVLGIALATVVILSSPLFALNTQTGPPGKALSNKLYASANSLSAVHRQLNPLLRRLQQKPTFGDKRGAMGQLVAIATKLDGIYARVDAVLAALSERAPEVLPGPEIEAAPASVARNARAIVDLADGIAIPPSLMNAMNAVIDKANGIALLAGDAVEMDPLSISLPGSDVALLFPDGSVEALPLSGTATNEVYFDGPQEGQAGDDDRDGLEDVATEMVALNLTGSSPTLGVVEVGLNPGHPSTGVIHHAEGVQRRHRAG